MNVSALTSTRSAVPLCTGARTVCRGAELCRHSDCSAGPLRIRILARGDSLPLPRDRYMGLQIVRHGLVATCIILADGRRQIQCLSLPGDVLCTIPMNGAETWHEALAQTEICDLRDFAFLGSIFQNSDLSGILIGLMQQRLERAAAHITTLGRFTAIERVCSFLADITRRAGVRHGDGWIVNLKMSREEIADYLGLNPDTVGRAMKQVKKEGLAHFPLPARWEIPSLTRLENRVPTVSAGLCAFG